MKNILIAVIVTILLPAYAFTQGSNDETEKDEVKKKIEKVEKDKSEKTTKEEEKVEVSSSPAGKAEHVDTEKSIRITFSVEMNQSSVESSFKITIKKDGSEIRGSMKWEGNTLIFVPEEPLPGTSELKIIISSGAESAKGIRLSEDYVVEFTTNKRKPPHVVGKSYRDTAVNFEKSYMAYRVTVTFSHPMDKKSVESGFALKKKGEKEKIGGNFFWGKTGRSFPLKRNSYWALIPPMK